MTPEEMESTFDRADAKRTEYWAMYWVKHELECQKDKWGVQDHNATVWATIIGEEYGEMCKEVNEFMFNPTPEIEARMFDEAIQTAACCIAMCGNMLRNSEAVREHANIILFGGNDEG